MTQDVPGRGPARTTAPAAVDLGPRLRCTATTDGGLALRLEGSLDGDGVTRLHAALLDLTPEQALELTAGDVVVDLAAVDAVDLEALQLLVRLDQALESRGHTLRLSRPSPSLLRIVAGAGLLDALPLTTT